MRNGGGDATKKIQKYKVSVKIVPSSLSLPGMCALVSLVVVVVIVVVVVFRSIALQRAFFLPLFILSLSQRKCINPFAKPLSCALIIPPFFSHTPIIHSLSTYTCIAAGSLSVGGKQRSG